ncbi:DUF4148 domain-containing protein [Burkholderia pseudomallei]|uniref:DUF4148 domain-containing protein n=1 Tax=Burkholderia pseudomallei TaxID=28450 RepID=UPI00052A7F4E|nr:DUF4148 domain-containing protein [Burkholderia pseudomallei]AIV63018.1 hypothetical protein X993_405 [Burkholderia pseudomallei K42]
MNTRRFLAATAAVAAAALSATSALASTPDAPQSKTRAQVRAALIQTYRDGVIPTSEGNYPPSPATIDANRARLAATQPAWAREQQPSPGRAAHAGARCRAAACRRRTPPYAAARRRVR